MQRNRTVLEVLKWAEAVTILQTASLVCQLWHSVASSEELWTSLLESVPTEDLQPLPSQDRYRVLADLQHTPRLVSRTHPHLQVFNCRTRSFEQTLSFPSHLFNNSAAAVLQPHLFLCGKGRSARVSLFTGALVQLSDMLTSRKYHSAIAMQASVYVFGGRNLRSAERYIDNKEWTALPDMHAERSYFNACSKETRIYLCGGFTKHSEVFDTVSGAYTVLPFTLPHHWSTSFFNGDVLVCVANGTVSHISKDLSVTVASVQTPLP